MTVTTIPTTLRIVSNILCTFPFIFQNVSPPKILEVLGMDIPAKGEPLTVLDNTHIQYTKNRYSFQEQTFYKTNVSAHYSKIDKLQTIDTKY